MRYRLRTLVIVTLAAGFILVALSAFANGDDPPQPKTELPKTISVKEVELILRRAVLTGQRCGHGMNWNGKGGGWFGNTYKPITLPWNPKPQSVGTKFLQGFPSGNNTLIEFSGPGFCYKRLNDEPILTLEVMPAK